MRIVTMCPRCGSVVGYEESNNKTDICKYCNIERIRVDVDGEEFHRKPNTEFDNEEEKICRQFLYKLPTFSEEAYQYRHRQERLAEERLKELEDEIGRDAATLPHCPICNSTRIHKISGLNKAASVGLFGIFAMGHVSKTFKCDNCGYKW